MFCSSVMAVILTAATSIVIRNSIQKYRMKIGIVYTAERAAIENRTKIPQTTNRLENKTFILTRLLLLELGREGHLSPIL